MAKSQTFDQYARESVIKHASAAARDTSSLKNQLIRGELKRMEKERQVTVTVLP